MYPCILEVNYLFNEIFLEKDYYLTFESKTPTIIDCGCYVGLSVLFFKILYPESNIIGFEPHPKTFKILKQNIENNNLSHITLINKAVSHRQGSVQFSSGVEGTSRMLDEKTHGIEVESVLLSKYVDKPVDLLKMDIEGGEFGVIEDLYENKKLKFIKHIIMEVHPFGDSRKITKLLSMLENAGFLYKTLRVNEGYPIVHAFQG
jgi:FkbM family methyltransferase